MGLAKITIINLIAEISFLESSFSSLMDTSEENSCIVVSESEIYGLKSPHSSAVLDLNGDCISDLFVLSQKDPFSNGSVFFEAWIRTIGTDGAALFCLKYYEEVDYDVSQVAFADIG